MIKLTVHIIIVILLAVVLNSCSVSKNNDKIAEVDFCDKVDVQVTYNQNIYDVNISFSSGVMTLYIVNGPEAVSGLSFELNESECVVFYSDISRSVLIEDLPDTFFPIVIYNFLSEFNGIVVTDSFDTDNNCSYISRQISRSFITFEVFENEDKYAYSIIIT